MHRLFAIDSNKVMKQYMGRRKAFRYPVILPIVYYEGKARWTADMHLGDRIRDSGEYRKWIPDFRYEVVRIHDYSDQELLDRCDEMSLASVLAIL